MTEPRSGWTSLALSVGGILAFVVGLGYVLAAFNATSGGDFGFAVTGMILAPCLAVAGWVVGNRHASHPSGSRSSFWEGGHLPSDPGGQSDAFREVPGVNASPMFDGRTLGRAVLVFTLLPALAALGVFILVDYASSSIQIP
jgi:hypothetical protein